MKNKGVLFTLAGFLVVLAVLRSAGDVGYWRRYAAMLGGLDAQEVAALTRPRLAIAGEPAGLPRATPEAESLLPDALAQAREAAQKQEVEALVVHRHGHRVFEYFSAGRDGGAEVAGGELAALPLALALGVLADNGRVSFDAALQSLRDAMPPAKGWGNPWSDAARARFTLRPAPPLLLQDADGDVAHTLAQRVWLPLRAGPASLWGRDDGALRVDCCMVARLDDWMRLGDLLLGQGRYEGERLASPDWIRHLLATDAEGRAHPAWLEQQEPWRGDEPPAARDTCWFDLGTDLRIWLAPRRGIAVLVWAGDGVARDTLIPNIILRGINDQAPAIGGGGLNELVPGH
jgi:hypothetical protein